MERKEKGVERTTGTLDRLPVKNVGNLPLDFSEGVPDHTTSRATASQRVLFKSDKTQINKVLQEKHIIHTSSEEDDFTSRRKPLASAPSSAAASSDHSPEEETTKPQKQHSFTFATFHNSTMDGQYLAVRVEKRFGLLIDPGAASGFVGSDTLLQLMDHRVRLAGKEDEMKIDHNKVVPVSGINGVSESTLAQVTLPLTSNGHQITYTADVLGGDGNFCPALVGNPALREMNAVIFANWFEDGDGLIMVSSPASESDKVHHRMFRLLLTDSGHYMLPTDQDGRTKVPSQSKREAVLFCAQAAAKSMEVWPDVQPRAHHCFLSHVQHVGRQAEGERGEGEPKDEKNPGKNSEKINDKIDDDKGDIHLDVDRARGRHAEPQRPCGDGLAEQDGLSALPRQA